MKKYIILFIVAAFFGVFVYGWSLMKFMTSPSSQKNYDILIDIPTGSSVTQVARQLHKKKLITSVHKFKVITQLAKVSTKLQAGEYKLNARMSPIQILKILSQGKKVEYSITFQEGIHMYDMARMFQNKGFGTEKEFLALCRDREFISQVLSELFNEKGEQPIDSLEGYLFPDTYRFAKDVEAKVFIETLVKRFISIYRSISQGEQIQLSLHEHVILASIIEKETGAAEERRIISSVFHNRLRKKMPLQSDPTILYGILDKTEVMKKNITKTDIKTHTKYNTYSVPALPHGPIANPGRESLEAAVHPDSTEYLYFVSRNDGTHAFSKTLKEHNAAVAKWQLSRRNREGRSWRHLRSSQKEPSAENKKSR